MIQIYEFEFSAAHFYFQKKWTQEKNRKEFGLCFSEQGHGHGHDYRAEIYVDANLAKTKIEKLIHSLKSIFDHKHLNYEVLQLQDLVPTTENLALCLQNLIQKELGEKYTKLRLFETPSLWVEVTP